MPATGDRLRFAIAGAAASGSSSRGVVTQHVALSAHPAQLSLQRLELVTLLQAAEKRRAVGRLSLQGKAHDASLARPPSAGDREIEGALEPFGPAFNCKLSSTLPARARTVEQHWQCAELPHENRDVTGKSAPAAH